MRSFLNIGALILLAMFFSCKKPETRKPVSYSGGEFIKESIRRNKEVTVSEEKAIQQLIKKDSTHKYYQSKSGFWYKYLKANITDTITPRTGDIVELEFDIKDINGQIIYTKEETVPKIYIVDKQEIMVGLRHAVKIMRKGEVISFIFPSHMGFGYLGDKQRIDQEMPIICEVTLKDIKKD